MFSSLSSCSLMTNGQDWEDYRKDMQPGLHSEKRTWLTGLRWTWTMLLLNWCGGLNNSHFGKYIGCCITMVWYVCLSWPEDKSTFMGKGKFIQEWSGQSHSRSSWKEIDLRWPQTRIRGILFFLSGLRGYLRAWASIRENMLGTFLVICMS